MAIRPRDYYVSESDQKSVRRKEELFGRLAEKLGVLLVPRGQVVEWVDGKKTPLYEAVLGDTLKIPYASINYVCADGLLEPQRSTTINAGTSLFGNFCIDGMNFANGSERMNVDSAAKIDFPASLIPFEVVNAATAVLAAKCLSKKLLFDTPEDAYAYAFGLCLKDQGAMEEVKRLTDARGNAVNSFVKDLANSLNVDLLPKKREFEQQLRAIDGDGYAGGTFYVSEYLTTASRNGGQCLAIEDASEFGIARNAERASRKLPENPNPRPTITGLYGFGFDLAELGPRNLYDPYYALPEEWKPVVDTISARVSDENARALVMKALRNAQADYEEILEEMGCKPSSERSGFATKTL